MTAPDSGATRPGRVAGVALLGLAAVALVLGLVTIIGGSSDGESAQRPPEPPVTTTSSTTAKPPATTSSSRPRPPATTTKTRPPTGSTTPPSQTTPPGGDGNGEPTKTVPVRVLNNSLIKGLAIEAANDLKADGWQVVEVGNYPDSTVPETTVYFRPGTDEEAAARTIAADFGFAVAPRIETLNKRPAGVIVIVTKDYKSGGGKNEG